MSVFRYGSVGPNFQPNLLSERALMVIYFIVWACGKKGKMVNIPLLLEAGDLRWRHQPHRICLLVDCRTQQTFRVFLTRISNIISSEPIIGCDRVLAWQRIDPALAGWIDLSNFEDVNHIMANETDPAYCLAVKYLYFSLKGDIYPTWGTVPETAAGLQGSKPMVL